MAAMVQDLMTSYLHKQRLEAVQAIVRKCRARTLLDLGCGDGDLLTLLAMDPQIEKIVGIDLSLETLQRLRRRISALKGDTGAHVDLVHGSMIEARASLAGFDCAVLVETIEHIDPDQLSALERSVFGVMRPSTVVITTPNADFNSLLGVPPDSFRHPGHRFEWGRAKFQRWALGVSSRNGYGVACSDLAGRHPVHGGASQMAVFEVAVRPTNRRHRLAA